MKDEKTRKRKVHLFVFDYQGTRFAVTKLEVAVPHWLMIEVVKGIRFFSAEGKDVSDALYMHRCALIQMISSGEIVPVPPFEKYDGIYVGDRVLTKLS